MTAYRMKTYRIQNTLTKQWWEGNAYSAHEACQKAGWNIAHCWIRERVQPHRDRTKQSGQHYGGWRNTKDVT